MANEKLLYRDEIIARLGEETPMKATPGEAPAQSADGVAGDQATGVTISESAAREIRRQQDKRGTPGAVIRIGIRGGGCTGFSYVFDWDEGGARETDHIFTEHGVSVLCDPKSLNYLRGTEIDFQTSMMGYGFKFNNPNAKGSCGCGESVQF